jgi:hypothetical protein
MQSLLAITTESITIMMYVLVVLLLIGNILFLILFIGSTAKCADLENQLKSRTGENISNTEHDRNADQPVGARMEDKQQYLVIESKDNFNVVEKESQKVVAVAKSKDEAREIIKSMAQKN